MSLAINFEKQKKSKDVSKDEGGGRLNALLVFAVEKKSHIGRCLNFSTSKTEKENKADRVLQWKHNSVQTEGFRPPEGIFFQGKTCKSQTLHICARIMVLIVGVQTETV